MPSRPFLLSFVLIATSGCGQALPDLILDRSGSVCGDGVTQSGEACDDGNDNDFDACLSTCREASCHDGFRRSDIMPGMAG